jgi:hypothetical protein
MVSSHIEDGYGSHTDSQSQVAEDNVEACSTRDRHDRQFIRYVARRRRRKGTVRPRLRRRNRVDLSPRWRGRRDGANGHGRRQTDADVVSVEAELRRARFCHVGDHDGGDDVAKCRACHS